MRKLFRMLDMLSLTSAFTSVLKLMLDKSRKNAFWLKWEKSQKYLASFEVGSVLAIVQNTGRWSEMSAKQTPDLMTFPAVFV